MTATHDLLNASPVGPVAPADMIGGSNAPLVMQACDQAGHLLSPDRPATLIDAAFAHRAFGGVPGPKGAARK